MLRAKDERKKTIAEIIKFLGKRLVRQPFQHKDYIHSFQLHVLPNKIDVDTIYVNKSRNRWMEELNDICI